MKFPIKNAVVKTFVTVNYGDLDDFINDHYADLKSPYESCADMEWNYGDSHSFSLKIDPKKLTEWDEQRWTKFNNGEYVICMLPDLLQDLVNGNVLPECELLVSVCL